MGLSSNQARFLSLTARQVDMEQRIQQICQRRLRLSSELENVATQYNNQISNRKMFLANQTSQGIQALSVANLESLGYKVLGLGVNTDKVKDRPPLNTAGKIVINSQEEFLNLVSKMNSNQGLDDDYVLACDIDLAGYDTAGQSLIKGVFTGSFDGNGHVINNLKIDTQGVSTNDIGMFARLDGAIVSNVALNNVSINAVNSTWVGGLSGGNTGGSIVDNCYVLGSINAKSNAGGIIGYNNSEIKNCTVDVDISGVSNLGGLTGTNIGTIKNTEAKGDVVGTQPYDVGGFVGGNYGGLIDSSSSSGNVTGSTCVGGFAGTNSYSGIITNSFTTAPTVSGSWTVGGFAGNNFGTGYINNCYAVNNSVSGSTTQGFANSTAAANAGDTNFYINPVGHDKGGTNSSVNTTGWSTSIWDLSGSLPKLNTVGYTAYTDDLETGLRNGTYSLAREADEFTQDSISINGKQYQQLDWRTTPEIFDELYKGDDVEAENKYDKIVAEINAQDKKLQLEQTSIEVEYKAVTSERESVKKILDTNAQASFKYFS